MPRGFAAMAGKAADRQFVAFDAKTEDGSAMRLVSPETINLSRAYFTELDRVTYSQVA